MGIITDVCKAWIVYHKTVRNFLTMVNHLLIDWLNFTTFGITSISVGFPFFGNTKTTMTVKNSDIRKSYIFWDFLYGFAFFQHTLKSLKILASKIRMICTNLPLLALDNQPEPCLWQFPFDFRQQLQISCNTQYKRTRWWKFFWFTNVATSSVKLYRTHIFKYKPVNIQIIPPIFIRGKLRMHI